MLGLQREYISLYPKAKSNVSKRKVISLYCWPKNNIVKAIRFDIEWKEVIIYLHQTDHMSFLSHCKDTPKQKNIRKSFHFLWNRKEGSYQSELILSLSRSYCV